MTTTLQQAPGQTDTITTVTEQLQSEETKLKAQLQEHQTQVNTIQADLTRLQQALKALSGNNKTQRKSKRPNTKPAATQELVNQVITDAFAGGHPLTREQITKQVQQSIVEDGKSRVGLALRIKQALESEAFAKHLSQ